MEVETCVRSLFEEILGVTLTSEPADFFALGGHSLSLIKLAARLRKRFEIELSLEELGAARTSRAIAAVVQHALEHAGKASAGTAAATVPSGPGGAEAAAARWLRAGHAWIGSRWSSRPLGLGFQRGHRARCRTRLSPAELSRGFEQLANEARSIVSCLQPGDGGWNPCRSSPPWSVQVLERADGIDAAGGRWLTEPLDLEWGPLLRVVLAPAPQGLEVAMSAHVLLEDECDVRALLRDALAAALGAASGEQSLRAGASRIAAQATVAPLAAAGRQTALAALRNVSWWQLPIEPGKPVPAAHHRAGHLAGVMSAELQLAATRAASAAGVGLGEALFAAFASCLQGLAATPAFALAVRVSPHTPSGFAPVPLGGAYGVVQLDAAPGLPLAAAAERAVRALRLATHQAASAADVLGLYAAAGGDSAFPVTFEIEAGDVVASSGERPSDAAPAREPDIEWLPVAQPEARADLWLTIRPGRELTYQLEYRRQKLSSDAARELLQSWLGSIERLALPPLAGSDALAARRPSARGPAH